MSNKILKIKNGKIWFWLLVAGIVSAIVLSLIPVGLELISKKKGSVDLNKGRNVKTFIFSTVTPTPIPVLTVKNILEWSREIGIGRVLSFPQNEVTQVILTGDVMLGRAVNFNMHRKNDFDYPMAKVGDKLREADIAMVNLEAPIIGDCFLMSEGMKFCADPLSLNTLLNAGIDVVNLANNHVGDYGVNGIEETKKWLNTRSILDAGLRYPAVKNIRGTRFGFLGFSNVFPIKKGIAKADVDQISQEISKLKKSADVIVVSFHWGEEYKSFPNLIQKKLARVAIDAGADVVFGHHPHWIQGIEIYKGKPIFYSLGNFIFDQMWSNETREGLGVELYFWKDELVEVKLLPIFMNDFAQPVWQPTGVNSPTLRKVEKLSQGI